MSRDSKRIGSVLLSVAAVAALGLAPTAPAQAKPDIKDVKEKVDRLYHEAEQAQERLNDARLELTDLREDLKSLRADEKVQSDRLAGVREDVANSVLRQLEGQSISSVGQVVVSDDPTAFLGQLTTMSAYNDMQSALFEDYSVELSALDLRRSATAERAGEIEELTATLASEEKAVDAKLSEAKELLADLEAEERARLMSSTASSVAPPSSVPASGRAAAAIKYALAQVGDAYVYGAAGESAFDCSGLTMRAWGTAGVGLPHSSSAQFSSGPRIAASDLQPGDLVFYYSPISHVGLYLGNGLIVHAANPGAGVRVSGLYSMPYVGAVRPG